MILIVIFNIFYFSSDILYLFIYLNIFSFTALSS